jgi:DNA-binding transcriptional regulator/RsmH inhibitor MraZ
MGILDKIKSFFKLEKKVYVVKVTPEILQKVPALLKKELGMKDAIILKQSQEIEKLKKEIEKLKGKESKEEAVVKELLKEKVKVEKQKNAKRLRLVFHGIPLPRIKTFDFKFFHDGKKAMKFLKGYEREETDKGEVINLLLVPESNSKDLYRRETGLPFELLFINPESFVSQVLSGDIRVRIDSKGIYHAPEEIQEVEADPPTKKETYKKISEMRKEYEQKIAELKQELNRAYSEIEKAREREEKAQLRLLDAELGAKVNDFRADLSQSYVLMSVEKIKGMMKDYLNVLISSQESEVNRVLTERLNDILVDAFNSIKEKLGMELPQEVRDAIREQVRAEFLDTLDFLHELTPAKVEIEKKVTPPAKPEKGEKK